MHKGTLKAGVPVRTTLACAGSNAGTTAMTQMFMSDDGSSMPPPVQDFVVPGNTLNRENPVPQSAAACRVSVDLPAGGKVTLTIEQGSARWTGALSGGDTWLFDIAP